MNFLSLDRYPYWRYRHGQLAQRLSVVQDMTSAPRVITLFADTGRDGERAQGERYFHDLGALNPASAT